MPAICRLWRRRKSCSRTGNDCNQQERPLAGANAAIGNLFVPALFLAEKPPYSVEEQLCVAS